MRRLSEQYGSVSSKALLYYSVRLLTYLLTYRTRYAAFDAIAAAHVYHLEGGRGVLAAEARRGAAKRTRRRKSKSSL